jgi:hypothetical protein
LILKTKKERVDRISASSLEEACYMYMSRKRMEREVFNKMYEVVKNER